MGSTMSSDEKPVNRVTLKTLQMSKTEVTTAQYLRCVRKNRCRPPHWQERGSSYNL